MGVNWPDAIDLHLGFSKAEKKKGIEGRGSYSLTGEPGKGGRMRSAKKYKTR